MARTKYVRGEMTQGDRPNWKPLEDLVGDEVVGDFMWMYEVELADENALQAYKHIDTRRYIHLDARGKAWGYRPEDRYHRVDAADVLTEVFAILPGLAGVTARQIRASYEVVERLCGAAASDSV